MFTMLLMVVFSCLPQEKEMDKCIEQAIKNELHYFPEAQLRDIYKNFFQDAYGPGHLIPNTTHAGRYLSTELQQPIDDTLQWQPVGPANDYYRINLQLVKDGVIPRAVLLEAMVESAVLARNPDIDTWKGEWQQVMAVIEKMNLQLANFEPDKKEIEALLAGNEYVMHHSEHYNSTYNRHYRIVHKTVFNRWKDSFLKEPLRKN